MVKNILWVVIFGSIFGSAVLMYKKFFTQQKKMGKVILLDGTSSVGKSAIIAEFKKLRPDYTVIKVDDWYLADIIAKAKSYGWKEEDGTDAALFLRQYITQKNDRHYLDTTFRQEIFADWQTREYLEAAKKEVQHGRNVIIDTVLEDSKQYGIFTTTFAGIDTLKVLVYCPLSTILERVEKRNASSDAGEHRTSFLSFEQFPQFYKVQESENELVVDCVQAATMKRALEKSVKDLLDQGLPLEFVPVINECKAGFIEHFQLDTCENVALVATRPYDIVLQSGKQSPLELAQSLSQALNSK